MPTAAQGWPDWGWPEPDDDLVALQVGLGEAAMRALATDECRPSGEPLVLGGCFVVHARGTPGPGRQGDPAWAAAVAWRPGREANGPARRTDRHLRGVSGEDGPRRADDVLAQCVLTGRATAPYVPGLLAGREGPLLAAALYGLDVRPDVVLVDASGRDHPRGAGLAVHLGAATGLPTVGITRRPLLATGAPPELRRGAISALRIADRCVAFWVCTRSGVRPLVAHAGWRTSPETAARLALEASTPAARTPVPLQEARRVAHEARSGSPAG